MNQNRTEINLREFTADDHPFGNVQGKETFRRLIDYIDSHPTVKIVGISLANIVATDASFPRESVISVAKHFRTEKGIFLKDIQDRDLIDNWMYAANAKEQPIFIWHSDERFELIGPEINSSALELVNYVAQKGRTSASQVACDLQLSVPNASTRLKKLFTQGYFLRTELVADSGGLEYQYEAIK